MESKVYFEVEETKTDEFLVPKRLKFYVVDESGKKIYLSGVAEVNFEAQSLANIKVLINTQGNI